MKADAPMVDTAGVQIGETVDQERIDNLPLAGRNVYDLIGLMPAPWMSAPSSAAAPKATRCP